MTRQLVIAQISLCLIKRAKCQTIFCPNKSIFEAKVYHLKRSVISVQKVEGLQQTFDCEKGVFDRSDWPLRNLDPNCQATAAG